MNVEPMPITIVVIASLLGACESGPEMEPRNRNLLEYSADEVAAIGNKLNDSKICVSGPVKMGDSQFFFEISRPKDLILPYDGHIYIGENWRESYNLINVVGEDVVVCGTLRKLGSHTRCAEIYCQTFRLEQPKLITPQSNKF